MDQQQIRALLTTVADLTEAVKDISIEIKLMNTVLSTISAEIRVINEEGLVVFAGQSSLEN